MVAFDRGSATGRMLPGLKYGRICSTAKATSSNMVRWMGRNDQPPERPVLSKDHYVSMLTLLRCLISTTFGKKKGYIPLHASPKLDINPRRDS